jgi:hypothetical protein
LVILALVAENIRSSLNFGPKIYPECWIALKDITEGFSLLGFTKYEEMRTPGQRFSAVTRYRARHSIHDLHALNIVFFLPWFLP